MEADSKLQIKVGLFLAIGLVSIMVSITMLGANSSLLKSYAEITARFEQVQGLAEGSVVSLSGVVVGNVDRIEFNTDNSDLIVHLKVAKNFLKNIASDSKVEIRTQGALGDKYIYISPGDLKNGFLKEGNHLEVLKSADILNIIASRGNETGKIFDIISDIHLMTQTLTKDQRLEKILNSLVTSTNNLAKTSSNAERMTTELNFTKLQASMTKLDNVMTKLDRGDGTLGALINDPSLHQQLKTMLGVSDRKNSMKSLLRGSIEKNEK